MGTRVTAASRRIEWITRARLPLLIGAALVMTTLGLPQPVTGPLVNALLLLTVAWAGVSEALVVGMVTPMGAALRGVLPLPLVLMIPFIALGNAAFVSLYAVLRGKDRWLALGVAAVAKFAVLAAVATVLAVRPVSLPIAGTPQVVAIPAAIVEMMRWPQLATALAGGLIAFGVESTVHRRLRQDRP